MNTYLTGGVIRTLREAKGLTQNALAERLGVSDKAVSKWETGKGYPDITLIEPLARLLGVSVAELFSGEPITNQNRGFNMKRSRFYVCPVCGNFAVSAGEMPVSCHGITLPPLLPEPCDETHEIHVQIIENELYVTADHPMTKDHYLSFFAALSDQAVQVVKLYPEQNAEAYFPRSRTERLLAYCNRHGLFQIKL